MGQPLISNSDSYLTVNDNALNVHLVVNDDKVALKALAYLTAVGKSYRSRRIVGSESEGVNKRCAGVLHKVSARRVERELRACDLACKVEEDIDSAVVKVSGRNRAVEYARVGYKNDSVVTLYLTDKALVVGVDVDTDGVTDYLGVDLAVVVYSLVNADTAALGIYLKRTRRIRVVRADAKTVRNKLLYLRGSCLTVSYREANVRVYRLRVDNELLYSLSRERLPILLRQSRPSR